MPRITGRMSGIYLRSASGALDRTTDKVSDTRTWTMEIEQEAAPCPIKGEVSDTYGMGGISTRITVERFLTNVDDAARLADKIDDLKPASGNTYVGMPVQYLLEQIDGGEVGASVTGTGVIVRVSIGGPRELAIETLEIMGTTVPVFS